MGSRLCRSADRDAHANQTPTRAGSVLVVEGHDPACATCHLPPETEFLNRARAPHAEDLASAHSARADAPGTARCIDCHAGVGAQARLNGLTIAAADTWSWWRGVFVVVGHEFAPLGRSKRPFPEAACAACHAAEVTAAGFENHFHNLLTESETPSSLTCTSCHPGHALREGQNRFLTDADARQGCDDCHSVMSGPTQPLIEPRFGQGTRA